MPWQQLGRNSIDFGAHFSLQLPAKKVALIHSRALSLGNESGSSGRSGSPCPSSGMPVGLWRSDPRPSGITTTVRGVSPPLGRDGALSQDVPSPGLEGAVPAQALRTPPRQAPRHREDTPMTPLSGQTTSKGCRCAFARGSLCHQAMGGRLALLRRQGSGPLSPAGAWV